MSAILKPLKQPILQPVNLHTIRTALIEHAITLLSQQLWCWGRDISRPEGNWLVEIGFERIESPLERKKCSSMYSLKIKDNQCIILRGFGVFYGNNDHGGIFLPRYKFLPRYSEHSNLKFLPWEEKDLPKMEPPSEPQQTSCETLTIDLINWIINYEENIVKQLGIEYRQSTLAEWDNRIREIIPAEKMTQEWRLLGIAISEEIGALNR